MHKEYEQLVLGEKIYAHYTSTHTHVRTLTRKKPSSFCFFEFYSSCLQGSFPVFLENSFHIPNLILNINTPSIHMEIPRISLNKSYLHVKQLIRPNVQLTFSQSEVSGPLASKSPGYVTKGTFMGLIADPGMTIV